jgi:hypothetical protein
MSAPPAPTPIVCSLEGCAAPAAAGSCAKCHTAHYCSRDHQQAAWKAGHKKWCRLVGTSIEGSGCGSLVFVGQLAGKELVQHPTYSTHAVLAAARKGGYAKAEGFSIDKGVVLCKPLDPAALPALWPKKEAEELVIPRRRFVLVLQYCIGTLPAFVATAPPGAAGFTRAEVVGACVRAYQWVYEQENAPFTAAGKSAPRMSRGMLNRGFTQGPFQISMHDLEDLLLHGISISGGWPAAAAGAGGAAEDSDNGPISVLVTPSGIDS